MISVVIPSYNGAETLFQAIDSVFADNKNPAGNPGDRRHPRTRQLEKMGVTEKMTG